MPQWLSEADCKAVLQSLLSAELAVYRGTSAPNWQDTPAIDSLERLHLAACVNEFFCLHETGAEDRLLMTQSFDDWASLVARAITETSGLTFRTSGSTGSPTAHLYRWEDIEAEAHALMQRFASRAPIHRVISWLPLHHLYGFMLGVALPSVLGIPRISADNAMLPALTAGDVVVTVPPRWDYLARSRNGWPANVVGVSSTAPLSADTSDALIAGGLTGLLEIYGSTETGGVATRWQKDEPYRLLAHWQRADTQHIQGVNSHIAIPLLDNAHWYDEHTFTLLGRHDDVVTIGGVNVSPQHVAERLRALESVAECAIRTTGPTTTRRLKAFVVPVISKQETASAIAQATAQWPAAERPVGVTYGDALPTNALGKLTDW
ncbi:AMP-binding protein [Vreelandella boliviensis]|uniref:4-coumarate--CoA ligase () n=1 Tax=Vreelandella boliviensis LC1 TaxID=1072583 RepID=A0A265E2H4_9GAMM|nr:AMP-binding protein [Halomonas boliviensis]EHJ93690.1 4-coumarate--CoA ligase () [Halomonas boliviensis LC1]OZT75803.1 acyl-CoA synthetase [Halomonas boliviensis LC1]